MKKVKQIIALIGVIVLVGLYAGTLVLACIGGERAAELLKASIYATIVLPVLLWAYSFIYRLLKNHYSEDRLREADEQKHSGTTEKEDFKN